MSAFDVQRPGTKKKRNALAAMGMTTPEIKYLVLVLTHAKGTHKVCARNFVRGRENLFRSSESVSPMHTYPRGRAFCLVRQHSCCLDQH